MNTAQRTPRRRSVTNSGISGHVHRNTHRAFLEMRLLRILYVDAQGRKTERVIEAQYLLLTYPVWYVIAWDQVKDAVRSFRCDRIVEASMEETGFRGRPLADVRLAIEGIDAITP